MELEELIVEIVIGLFLLFTSYQIGIKENITLLHGYHYTQLDPKDKKVFTKKIGIGTLLVSIGILVMPIINLISHSELGYYIGLILIVVGVFYIIFFKFLNVALPTQPKSVQYRLCLIQRALVSCFMLRLN